MTAQPDPRARRLKIEVNGVGLGSIEIEGKDVSAGVRGFVLRGCVGEVTTAELDVVAPKGGTFDGVARIEITPELRAIMLAAGWTPPAEPVEPLGAACVAFDRDGAMCRLQRGHEGLHENEDETWNHR